MGVAVAAFPTAGHLASWAGVCPGNKQSSEKRQRSPARKGDPWLKTALVEAAKAAGRTQTYRAPNTDAWPAASGPIGPALAVAHSIAVISHRIIDRGEDYVDLGYHYFDQRDRDAITRRANWNAWGKT